MEKSRLPQPPQITFDRRYSFSRHPDPRTPAFSRSLSTIDIALPLPGSEGDWRDHAKWVGAGTDNIKGGVSLGETVLFCFRGGNRGIRRLFLLISLNVAYSTAELVIGLLSGRVGLVSDAFHLTFGCGLLTFSLFAMAASRRKPDRVYTYGYKRLEVLSAFTNADVVIFLRAGVGDFSPTKVLVETVFSGFCTVFIMALIDFLQLFLLFMSFSLAVEALHAFIQDESEHKHYLIVSAVTNLLVNLIGVWFFRNYARISLAYRNAEDMNYHSVCLHVISDSIRSAGLILASWLLSMGIQNAEVLCLGLVSVTVFMIAMPLFKATGGVLLQMAPPSVPSSAMSKCYRQIAALEDVSEISEARFWELVPGHVVGSLSLQVKAGIDDKPVLQFHQLPEFDQGKRSCRRRLAGHNECRRKPPPGSFLSSRLGRLSSSLFGDSTARNGGFLLDFSSYSRQSGRDPWPGSKTSEGIPGSHSTSPGKVHHSMWPGSTEDHPPEIYLQGSAGRSSFSIPSGECITGVSSDSSCALSLLSNQTWGSKNQASGTALGHLMSNDGASMSQFTASQSVTVAHVPNSTLPGEMLIQCSRRHPHRRADKIIHSSFGNLAVLSATLNLRKRRCYRSGTCSHPVKVQ